jgi:hypothetical protein
MPSTQFLYSRWLYLEFKKRLRCTLCASLLPLLSPNTKVLNLIGRNISAVKSQSDNYIKVCVVLALSSPDFPSISCLLWPYSHFQAYEIQQPSWVIQDRRLAWGGGLVKMIFPIKGSTGSAVVSVFATKEAGKYVIRQLGIQTVFGTASFPFLNPCLRFTHRSHSAADDIHLTGDPSIPLAGRELMIFEAKPTSALRNIPRI